jgi:sugar lactone lactonase YvrE
MRIAGVAFALALAVARASSPQEAAPPNARTIYAAGIAAYERKDYPAYLARMREAADLRPTHPTILYKLAGAYGLNRQPADAAAVLRKLAALNLYFDLSGDPDFSDVSADPAVRAGAGALAELRGKRVGSSTVAWTIPDRMFIPEGVAFDPVSKDFFVSSQYRRKIVRVDASGRVGRFTDEGQDGLWMVFGIAVDAPRRLLWAVSTAEPQMSGFTRADENHAGVFAFDIATGKLVRKAVVEPVTPRHYFDDLTVGSDGRVFISDGGHGAIYTLAPGKSDLEVLIPPGTIQGPNGLTLEPSGSRLYVSDYAGFIFSINVAAGTATRLTPPADASIYGIDGLAWHDGGLIGIQNGVNPARVVRLALSPDGSRIDAVRILEMNHPAFGEPT